MLAAAYAASAARPFGAMIEIGVRFSPALPPSRTSNSPTANAMRYDGNGGVRWKVTSRQPGAVARSVSTGMLANARIDAGTSSVSFHAALRSGSSNDGNTRRASSGSNCVTAYHGPPSCCRNRPTPPTRSIVPV